MQKLTIDFDCLFLHDTQMADLEREQSRFRMEYHRRNPDSPLPFNFLAPICPASRSPFPGKLLIGAPVIDSGWIIRPVEGLPKTAIPANVPKFPGYPPLPRTLAFILGYAGSDSTLPDSGGIEAFHPFSVNVGFYARLLVRIECDEGRMYGAFTEQGKSEWHKAGETD